MTKENFAYLLVGAILIYTIYQNINKDKDKEQKQQQEQEQPLQSDINPQKIEPDSISRALDKLKQGDVKVNDTPVETKNAVGQ